MTEIISQNKQNASISLERLSKLREFYYMNAQKSYEKCVEMAVNLFYECFYFLMIDLLQAFPIDSVDK